MVAPDANAGMIGWMRWRLVLLLLALPAAAGADPAPTVVRLKYAGYHSGFHVLSLDTELLLASTGYRITMTGHTTGMIGFLYHARWQSRADGLWHDSDVAPLRFDTAGVFGGHLRRVSMVFQHDDPVLRALQPPDDGEHEPFVPATTRGAIDSLSLTVMVIHQVAMLGHCEGQTTVFDGRQVTRMTLRAAGAADLPATDRSSWHGPTLRCDLGAQVLSGFFRDQNAEDPPAYTDSMWLANVLPGVPPLPVRSTATTHHLGRITLYLTGATLRDGSQLTTTRP